MRQLNSPNLLPDDDCLVNKDVGLPQLLDVYRVLEEDVALVAGVGAREGVLGGRKRLLPRQHPGLVVLQSLVLPVHPAGLMNLHCTDRTCT